MSIKGLSRCKSNEAQSNFGIWDDLGTRGRRDGLSFLRLVASIGLVFPQCFFCTTEDGDKSRACLGSFFFSIAKLQVELQASPNELAFW